ncbi:hypothetical protein N7504_004329 [Penicillium tannophilum]|nr:hypothetical protein N7504_004329 [Penicillium tannophilum]
MPPQRESMDEYYHGVSAEELLELLKTDALCYMLGDWLARKDLSPAQFVRMESTAEPSANADEKMRLAVERFRTKMEASNRQFLQDRIN